MASTLERRGLLTRRGHPGDARRVPLTLTVAGAELMDKLFPSSTGPIVQHLEGTVSQPPGGPALR